MNRVGALAGLLNSHDLAIIAGATRDIRALTAAHCKDISETVEPTKVASTVIVVNVTQAYARLLSQSQSKLSGLLIHSPIVVLGTLAAVAGFWSRFRDLLPSDTVLAGKLHVGTRPAVTQGSNTVKQERPYNLSDWYDAMGRELHAALLPNLCEFKNIHQAELPKHVMSAVRSTLDGRWELQDKPQGVPVPALVKAWFDDFLFASPGTAPEALYQRLVLHVFPQVLQDDFAQHERNARVHGEKTLAELLQSNQAAGLRYVESLWRTKKSCQSLLLQSMR